jgi:RNA polymerase sigma-70 factor (ECF subfamily)
VAEFPSTRWTLIDAARQGDEEAVRRFVLGYRSAILSYLRRSGPKGEAEDLCQEVFVRLFSGGVLRRVHADKGRLRSLLRAVSRNVVLDHLDRRNAQKRGAGRVVAVGDIEAPAPEADDPFDRAWVKLLIKRSLARLAEAHPRQHQALTAFALEGRPQADVAAELGCPLKEVQNLVYRGKKRLLGLLRDEVWSYCATPEELADELAALKRYFPA